MSSNRRRSARRSKRGQLAALAVVVVLAVVAVILDGKLREFADDREPAEPAANSRPQNIVAVTPAEGTGYVYDRVAGPDRTVTRDSTGDIVATFTDGSRTAVLRGPVRKFAEPRTTTATVSTDSWVRLMPQPWKADTETTPWFRTWFTAALADTSPDVLAVALEYGDGAPVRKDKAGVQFAGDAGFGPINPEGSSGNDLRLEQTDFFDYLGLSWTFPDKKQVAPDPARHAMFDCSGFVRMVYGYRMGYPLLRSDVKGAGLPRTADGMATVGPGTRIIERTDPAQAAPVDLLLPGDLLFFEIDARTGARLDHTGIYLGLDDTGHPRFISSREEANGPTFGDLGGTSRIDGSGFYGAGLRTAKRL
ncbi:C40 family peptidase [Yinghuangia sp. ASG 101]|uniref:NlpC/P60 family protein n=1 Tax=Yinghuangia sp. ASG 101 TaxID=2896848 RepID=UPI001E5B3A96|nr:NlpC/P60 family protein [Yinghuangia sp. ASG 101]UGQ12312.1 C40 family peptidase [Yinghuangia sp. ASG 101]